MWPLLVALSAAQTTDTGDTAGADTAAPADTGADSAAPVDTGTVPLDSGTEPVDSGTEPVDSGLVDDTGATSAVFATTLAGEVGGLRCSAIDARAGAWGVIGALALRRRRCGF